MTGVHVLLVEDNPATAELRAMLLEYAGALVSSVQRADHAVALLDHVIPDVLVSDIYMPAKDGFWLIGTVRARPSEMGGAGPALAVTAADYTHQEILAAGFQAYLRKPIEAGVFYQTIAALVAKAA